MALASRLLSSIHMRNWRHIARKRNALREMAGMPTFQPIVSDVFVGIWALFVCLLACLLVCLLVCLVVDWLARWLRLLAGWLLARFAR